MYMPHCQRRTYPIANGRLNDHSRFCPKQKCALMLGAFFIIVLICLLLATRFNYLMTIGKKIIFGLTITVTVPVTVPVPSEMV